MANIFTNLIDAWQYDFVRSALEAGTVCALLAAAVGYFVVLRQMAFAGHALGHIGFAGACAGVVLGWGALPGMLVLNILAGAGMGLMGRRMQESDLIIGMTLAFCAGAGDVLPRHVQGLRGRGQRDSLRQYPCRFT